MKLLLSQGMSLLTVTLPVLPLILLFGGVTGCVRLGCWLEFRHDRCVWKLFICFLVLLWCSFALPHVAVSGLLMCGGFFLAYWFRNNLNFLKTVFLHLLFSHFSSLSTSDFILVVFCLLYSVGCLYAEHVVKCESSSQCLQPFWVKLSVLVLDLPAHLQWVISYVHIEQ